MSQTRTDAIVALYVRPMRVHHGRGVAMSHITQRHVCARVRGMPIALMYPGASR